MKDTYIRTVCGYTVRYLVQVNPRACVHHQRRLCTSSTTPVTSGLTNRHRLTGSLIRALIVVIVVNLCCVEGRMEDICVSNKHSR